MLCYAIELSPDDNDTVLVTCPALPEVTSYGETDADALTHALGAVEEAIGGRLAHWKDIPAPVPGNALPEGTPRVALPTSTALKIQLYRALRQREMTRAELARRLAWRREQVDRLFRLNHASRLDQIDAAAQAIGADVTVEIRAA